MKVAILSDIHSNPIAAQKAYDDAKALGCGRFVCLGDVVGYGPDPVGAIKWVQEHIDLCVKGNHDAGLVGELGLSWFAPHASTPLIKQRPLVTDKDKEWLRSLPFRKKEEIGGLKVAFAHGSAFHDDPFEYIDNIYTAMDELNMLGGHEVDIEFVGHTHHADAYSRSSTMFGVKGIKVLNDKTGNPLTIKIAKGRRYIFNAGSVGYPRNQRASIYCIFDPEARTVQYRSLPFDFGRYACALEDAGIPFPRWLDAQLASGYTVIGE